MAPRRFSGPLLPGTRSVRAVNRRNRYVPRAIVPKTKRAKKPAAGLKLSKPMKNLVLKEINKGREKKVIDLLIGTDQVTPAPGEYQSFNGAIRGETEPSQPGGADMWAVFPKIPQPDPTATAPSGAIERDGLVIKPLSLVISGKLWLDPYLGETSGELNSNFTSFTVRLFLFSSKKRNDYDALAALNPGTTVNGYKDIALKLLLNNGNTNSFDGTFNRAQSLRMNTDEITVHSMRNIVMTKEQLIFPQQTSPSGNQKACFKSFSFKCPLPKNINYATNKDVTPEAFAPVLAAGYSFNNGTGPLTAFGPSGPKIYWHSRFVYTDA